MRPITGMAVRRWCAWRRASGDARRDVLAIGLLVPVVHLAVRVFGYARTARWTAARRAGTAPDRDVWARRGADAIRRLRAHGIVRGTCLSRALALQRWLSVRGVATDVRFGVRPAAPGLAAHAWLEYGGAPLTDAPDVGDQFAPLGRTRSISGRP